jgi:isocitrate dehydrogenase
MANPSGLLLGAVQMLVHIGQTEAAENVHNAWLKTLEDGVHTYDIFKEGLSTEKVGTKEFADAVIARVGQKPTKFKAVSYATAKAPMNLKPVVRKSAGKKEVVGVDVFFHHKGTAPELVEKLTPLNGDGLAFKVITNRGTEVWPGGNVETFCTDHFVVRYLSDSTTNHKAIAGLLGRIADAGIDFIKTENLCTFDGKDAFSLGRGK